MWFGLFVILNPFISVSSAALILKLRFLESNGATSYRDSSGNTNTATCSNCPTLTKGGKFYRVVEFDGTNDHLVVEDADEFTPTVAGFTVSAWVRPHGFQTCASQRRWPVVSKSPAPGSSNNEWEWFLYAKDSGGNNFWSFVLTSSAGSYESNAFDSDINIATNAWYHLVGTSDANGKARLYIDGVEEAAGADDTLPSNTVGKVYVGFHSGSGCDWYGDGEVREVSVWDTVLSRGKVAQLYRSRATRYAGHQELELLSAPRLVWNTLVRSPTFIR